MTTPSPAVSAAARSPEVRALLDGIAEGAAERERRDESPFAQVAAVAKAGLGALSLPVDEGGQGASVRELLAFVIDLAEADPIVAHVLRTHYSQVLGFLRSPDPDVRRRWLDRVRAGTVLGNAISETGPSAAGGHEYDTRLDEVDGRLVLNGTKYYSTGTLYADWIAVAARVEGDLVATVMVPADRAGVSVVDDWDGMGQSRTGTGTTTFTDVVVDPDDVLSRRPRLEPRAPGDVAFLQLYLHALVAGILRSVVADATGVVRSRSRTFEHAPAPRAVDDPILHEKVGTLAATAWIAESAGARRGGRRPGRDGRGGARRADRRAAHRRGTGPLRGEDPPGPRLAGGRLGPLRRRRRIRVEPRAATSTGTGATCARSPCTTPRRTRPPRSAATSSPASRCR